MDADAPSYPYRPPAIASCMIDSDSVRLAPLVFSFYPPDDSYSYDPRFCLFSLCNESRNAMELKSKAFVALQCDVLCALMMMSFLEDCPREDSNRYAGASAS